MSAPCPLEEQILSGAETVLDNFSSPFEGNTFEARLQALESAAARLGGFSIHDFREAFCIVPITSDAELNAVGAQLVVEIGKTNIPAPLALSALSREPLHNSDRKSTGAYHTDFRLAKRIAELAAPGLNESSKVIDPACGAGILLAALTLEVCGMDRKKISVWLRDGVTACDLSPAALRGSLLSLAAMTDDLDSLQIMRSRWLAGDSLMTDQATWRKIALNGFDAVVANPPWEKVKVTRHEFLKSQGTERHYGSAVEDLDTDTYLAERSSKAAYAKNLVARYPLLGSGEPDLYKAFLDLHIGLLGEGGKAAILVPGGLIRSLGTEDIRRKLMAESADLSISVFDNKARFFAIDTRFKFVAVSFRKARTGEKKSPVKLLHEQGTSERIVQLSTAQIGRARLAALRPDLSVPEVRSSEEWKVFEKLFANGVMMGDATAGWAPAFCREVDMTRDKFHFKSKQTKNSLPLVEGRMVHQHRFGVKAYVSGTGRRAKWETLPVGSSRLAPQFFMPADAVSAKSLSRAGRVRAGFCDIAGQTNERSMMAALIPAGVICGNKVPTVVFENDDDNERLFVWLAVMNSFTFDWMLRRVLTTTINYFILNALPMPSLSKGGLPWRRIIRLSKSLTDMDTIEQPSGNTTSDIAEARASLDTEIAMAYGLKFEEMELMLDDFPLLDRSQPALPGENISTITKDTVLLSFARRLGLLDEEARRQTRVDLAVSLGARAYIPSEIDSDDESDENKKKTRGVA